MADHSLMKLGRVAPTPEQRKKALPLRRYTTAPLPAAPPVFHGAEGAPIAMWGNDRYGDCTFAALANFWAIRSKMEVLPFGATEDAVVKAYLNYTGGKDEGAVETQVLSKAAQAGFELGGDGPWGLAAWTSVSLRDVELCKSLIAIFGALYIGAELPLAAQRQTVWRKPAGLRGEDEAGSWGGHALLLSGFDMSTDLWDLPTWGDVKLAERGWLYDYVDELYLPLDSDSAIAANVDFAALSADFQAAQAA